MVEPSTAGDKEPVRYWAYDFGPEEPDQVEPGFVGVSEKAFYDKARGYGWVTGLKNISPELERQLADLSTWPKEKVDAVSPFKSAWEIVKVMQLNGSYLVGYNNRHSHSDRYNPNWGVDIEELDTKLDRDFVMGRRFIGFYYDPRIRQECLETRGAIHSDDDLSATFSVDVPNGTYTLLLGMGDNKLGSYRLSPFNVEVQGNIVLRHLQVRSLLRRKIPNVTVKDGQLRVRFFVSRNDAETHPWPWNTFEAWLVSYMLIYPAKAEDLILAREKKIERDHYEHLKSIVFVSGERTESRVEDGALIINEKPVFQSSIHNNSANDNKEYPYWCWANTIGVLARQVLSSAHFMSDRWQDRSFYDDYPFDIIGKMNDWYKAGFMVRVCSNQDFLNFMPHYLKNESPTMEDSRGKSLGRAPLNSELSSELTREAYVMMSQHIKDHPAHIGYEIWDEMPHMGVTGGHDPKSVAEYQTWLAQKYRDSLDDLNREWGTDYKTWEDVKPPTQPEATANYVNFYRFVSWCMTKQVKETSDVTKKLEPFHAPHGGKGQGTGVEDNSWDRAPAAECLRVEIALNVGRAAAEHYRIALEANQGDPGCMYAYYYPGVKKLGQRKPDTRVLLGMEARRSGYAFVLRKIFDGAKSNWWEEYNSPAEHVFHRTKAVRELGDKGMIKRWTGELVFFDEEGHSGPDIRVCPGALETSRAHQLANRLGPVFLPAHPPKSSVAMVMTQAAFVPWRGSGYEKWQYHEELDRFFKSAQVPYDVIRDDIFDRVDGYKVVVLGPFSWAVSPEQAEKLKAFVAKGGTLVSFDTGAFGDARNLHDAAPALAFGLEKTLGFAPRGIQSATPLAGSTVVAGTAAAPLVIRNAAGNGWWFATKAGTPVDEAAARKCLTELCAKAGVSPSLTVAADHEAELVDADVLKAKEGWLVGVSTIAQTDQKLTLKMHFLPEGTYDVVDVTGERPILHRDAEGADHLRPDLPYRHAWFVAKGASAKELAEKGVELDVLKRGGRVLYVRPAGAGVWVDAPDYELRGIALQLQKFAKKKEELGGVTFVDVAVVVGDKASPEIRAAAERIKEIIIAGGIKAEVVDASAVRTKPVVHEARVQLDGGDPSPKAEKFLVEMFNNEVVDTTRHLILLGSEESNALIAHLGKSDAFCYDKVLEKVTANYPGPGRGVIEVVDSVNEAIFDPRHESRDAIIVGGSDDAGTLKAAERFCAILKSPPEKGLVPLAREAAK